MDAPRPLAAPPQALVPAPIGDSPQTHRKLDQVIEYCEGLITRWGEDFSPNYDLEISTKAARRYLSVSTDTLGHYVIEGFDFSEVSSAEKIAITLPSRINGNPVVAVSDVDINRMRRDMRHRFDAVPPRAPVEALVLPHSLKLVGRGALNSLVPHHLYISRTVTTIDLTGLAGTVSYLGTAAMSTAPTPDDDPMVSTDYSVTRARSEGLDFAVEEGNPLYTARGGSLYSADGRRLLMLALPYQPVTRISPGTRVVDRDAYVYGHNSLRALAVPDSLEDAAFTPSSTCLWICSGFTPFYHHACEKGWMAATERMVSGRDFDYDPMPDGSARLVRCKGAPSVLEIPSHLDGRPVTSIGNNAFPQSVRKLVIADTVTHIMGSAPCPNLVSLTLPRNLEVLGPGSFGASELADPLLIPASTREIGRSSLGRALCTFAACGATVVINRLLTDRCFCQGVPPFDFTCYDRDLTGYLSPALKLEAIMLRLATPYALSDENRAYFQEFLLEHLDQAVSQIERSGDLNALNLLLEAGSFSMQEVDRIIERLTSAGQTACTIELMNYKHRVFGEEQAKPSARFSL